MNLAQVWRVCAALAASLVLAGCVSTGGVGSEREIRTDSDQTSAEKRARLRLELAAAYFGRGQTTTALDEVKQALASMPDLAEAFSLRGLIYASMNEPVLAEQSFQRALQLAPRDGGVLHNQAWFLCQQRRFDEADKQFALALAAPQYTDVARSWLARGVCQARANEWAEAERSLSRAFELDPGNPAAAFSFAEVLYQRGEYERARFYIGRVNGTAEQVNAQSLWLAARIERRMGNLAALENLARQLRERFPESNEALQLQRGRFDD